MAQHPNEPVILTSLERALDQNEAIQETVGQSAAELCLINAVLQHEMPDHVKTGDMAQALQRTDELEERIQASADNLQEVNEALKEEIQVRIELEQQLASTQAALEESKNGQNHQPPGPREKPLAPC